MLNHSDLQYSADIAEFLANFLKRIVKQIGQKFYDIFLLDHIANNCKKTPKWWFFAIFDGPTIKYYKSKVVVHKNRH